MTENIKQLRKRQHLTTALSFLLGFLGTCGIAFYGKTGSEISVYQENFTNSVLYLALFYLLTKGWKSVLNTAEKRVSAAAAISGFICAALLVLGAQLDYDSSIQWNYATVVKIILLAPVLQMLICLLFLYVERHKERVLELNISAGMQKVIVYFAILAVWGITYLALFPGVYGYDAPYQILQALGEMEVTTYQPVLHTFIMGKCVQLGHILCGSYEIGLGIYSFLQMAFLAYAAMKVCMYACSRTRNYLWLLGTVLFFVLFPLHGVLAVSSTKDIIFTGIFALIFIKVLRLTENPEGFCDSKKDIIEYCILLFFLFWFRSNGIYILIFMIPFLIILLRKHRRIWKRMLLFTVLPIAAFLITENAVMTVFDIAPGPGIREMLSIPCQQLARAYDYHYDTFTDEEKKTLLEIIPEENLEYHTSRQMISDSIKVGLDTEKLMEDPLKYISLYFKIGLKNPKSYIEGAMLSCLATWYPDKYYQDDRQYHPYIEIDMIDAKAYDPDYLELERYSAIPAYEKALTDLFQEAQWMRIPIISSLFTLGTYVWSLFLCFVYILVRKAYKYLLPISLLIGLIITIILGPVSLIRYGYPLIFVIPLVLTLFRIKTVNNSGDERIER